MHNQFDELCPESGGSLISPKAPNYYYPCCGDQPPTCDPFSQLGKWPGMGGSMLALLFIYIGCYMVAWIVLIRLSSTYE